METSKLVPPFAIPEEAFDKFKLLAAKQEKSFAQAVRDAMRQYLNSATGEDISFNTGEWGGRRERQDKVTDG